MRQVICCLLAIVFAGCGPSGFVSDDFELSSGFENSEFRVRPITVADAEKDYEAVMESIDIIHSSFLDDSWPTESFTLEQNRRDLAAKERKFERRNSSPTRSCHLMRGKCSAACISTKALAAQTRLSSCGSVVRLTTPGWILGLSRRRDWMKKEWPFEWVVYPGRAGTQSGVGQPN